MADPYDWNDDDRAERRPRSPGPEPREEAGHRAAQRYSEAVRGQDGDWRSGRDMPGEPRRYSRGGDYGAGWYGRNEAQRGYDVPGPYGRPREQGPHQFSDEAGRYDRYERDDGRGPEQHGHRGEDARAYAEHVRDAAQRGWQRMSHGVKRLFEEQRRPEDVKPGWRAGGMFGGDDRTTSLFSHGNGVPGVAPEGPHRGKGPRGYIRSDERICEDINDRLMADGRLDASDIEVRVESGETTLSGHVQSREAKRRAEDLAESVSGVKHLQNNLRVKPPEPAPQAQQQATPQAKSAPSPDPVSDDKIDPRGPNTGPRLN